MTLLEDGPPGPREVGAHDPVRGQPLAGLEQLLALLDRADEVLEPAALHRPRVADHEDVVEGDRVAVPLVDVPLELVGRIVDVHRVMRDGVRLDRRLRQAAQELEHRRVLVHAAEELRAIDPAARPLGDPRVADRALAELGADLLEDPDRLLGEKPERRRDRNRRDRRRPGRFLGPL